MTEFDNGCIAGAVAMIFLFVVAYCTGPTTEARRMQHMVWFSCGIANAVAAKLAIAKSGDR